MKLNWNKLFWIGASVLSLSFFIIVLAFGVPYLWKQPYREINRIQQSLPVKMRLSGKERAELVDRYRGTLVSSIGTAATIVGGIVLIVNVYISTKRLILDINKNVDDKKLAEARLISERFSKAIEQLGSKNIHICLGGIYSLEKIARESPSDYLTVMEVLTAFIREESPRVFEVWGEINREDPELGYDFSPFDDQKILPITIQTAATVIARRDVLNENGRPNDREELNLSSTELGSVQWIEAKLDGVRLFSASLKYADLSSAHLNKAELSNADLSNADLQKANLQKAVLIDAALVNADLRGADLRGADLSDANLSSADLRGADLRGADLHGAKLRGADMSGANLRGAKLRRTNMSSTRGLTASQLESALLCNTQLPYGIELKPSRDCKKLRMEQP